MRPRLRIDLLLVCAILLAFFSAAGAQTSQFSFQGTLNSGGAPANGNYDFEIGRAHV